MRIALHLSLLISLIPFILCEAQTSTINEAPAAGNSTQLAQLKTEQQKAQAEVLFDQTETQALQMGQTAAQANATAAAKVKTWKAAGAPPLADPDLNDGFGPNTWLLKVNRTGYIAGVNRLMVMANYNQSYAQQLVASYLLEKAEILQHNAGLRDPDSAEDSSDLTDSSDSYDSSDVLNDSSDLDDVDTIEPSTTKPAPTHKGTSTSKTEPGTSTIAHAHITKTITVHVTKTPTATTKARVTITITKHVPAPTP